MYPSEQDGPRILPMSLSPQHLRQKYYLVVSRREIILSPFKKVQIKFYIFLFFRHTIHTEIFLMCIVRFGCCSGIKSESGLHHAHAKCQRGFVVRLLSSHDTNHTPKSIYIYEMSNVVFLTTQRSLISLAFVIVITAIYLFIRLKQQDAPRCRPF